MQIRDIEILGQTAPRLTRRMQSPLASNCPMHLRRMCGTCAAFPGGAPMNAKGQLCAVLVITTDGPRSAASCKHWARKG